MKSIYSLLFLIIGLSHVHTGDSTIVFRQIDHADLLDIARQEDKPIMLCFHFDQCGACRKMEKSVFTDEKVYQFFNESFINFEINTLKGEGIEINKNYNIHIHPSFIFLDSNGKETHRIVGMFNSEEFLMHGESAKNSLGLSHFKSLYEEGKRDQDFLYDYVNILRDARMLNSTTVNEYFNSLDTADWRLEKNIRFIYEFCVHKNLVYFPYKSEAFDFMLKNQEVFSEYFEEDQVKTRIVWILSHALSFSINKNDAATFLSALDIIKYYDIGENYLFKESDGRITGSIKANNLVKNFLDDYRKKNGDLPKFD